MSESFAAELNNISEITLPDSLGGCYTVSERLGGNEFGDTFLLTENDSGKPYILKKSSLLKNAKSEGILAELSHEGLPRFVSQTETDGTVYTLREYIEGVSLEEYVRRFPMGPSRAVKIMDKLCDIAEYLHSRAKPIIHRDIKPPNIIINPLNGGVFLIDFEIARRYNENAKRDTIAFGTEGYASPEQYGGRQTDQRSDVFSMGAVFRFMLTGSPLGEPKNKFLARIADKCTAFSPDDRYQSAASLKIALLRYKYQRGKSLLFIAVCAVLTAAAVFFLLEGYARIRYGDIITAQAAVPVSADGMPQGGDELAVFAEPLIEEAVRMSLGLEETADIKRHDLLYVTGLYIFYDQPFADREAFNLTAHPPSNGIGRKPAGNPIDTLADLSRMTNLRQVRINGHLITDLTPLAECVWLEEIELEDNMIASVSPLANMKFLKHLDLHGNFIEELAGLEKLRYLMFLNLNSNPITTIDDLGGIYQLNTLLLGHTGISSLDGIEKYTKLSELHFAGTNVSDFSALNGLPALKSISIRKDMEQYVSTITRDDLTINFHE